MKKNEQIKCFAIMPFIEDFNCVWSAIQTCITNLTNEGHNIIVRRADDHTIDSRLNENVTNNIKDCDIAIVDVTGQNSNVIFEFGYVLAWHKNFVPITQTKVSELASDYKNFIYLKWSPTTVQPEGRIKLCYC